MHCARYTRLAFFVQVVRLLFAYAAANDAIITESPMSVTALIGTSAQFSCAGAGRGIGLIWKVDNESVYHDSILINRGIKHPKIIANSTAGTLQSNLTVPATSENNGTTVRCQILSSSGPVDSNTSTLTVLTGIGHVLNLSFNQSLSTILWDPPSTADVLSSLYYYITVTNTSTSVVIINTTTTSTSYPIVLQHCRNYTATVAAALAKFKDEFVSLEMTIPGEYYKPVLVSKQVVICRNYTLVHFSINLKLPGACKPCWDQKLIARTYPQSNMKNVTSQCTHHVHAIEESDTSVNYTISIPGKQHCAVTFSVVGNQASIKSTTKPLNFSTFDVQHCDVHTDNTSILVECTFATNSIAPGFVLVQDEHSLYTVNRTLQRQERDSKGSVNITYLPAGEYSVTVYDDTKLYFLAFRLDKPLKIFDNMNVQPSSTAIMIVLLSVIVIVGAVVALICVLVILYCIRMHTSKKNDEEDNAAIAIDYHMTESDEDRSAIIAKDPNFWYSFQKQFPITIYRPDYIARSKSVLTEFLFQHFKILKQMHTENFLDDTTPDFEESEHDYLMIRIWTIILLLRLNILLRRVEHFDGTNLSEQDYYMYLRKKIQTTLTLLKNVLVLHQHLKNSGTTTLGLERCSKHDYLSISLWTMILLFHFKMFLRCLKNSGCLSEHEYSCLKLTVLFLLRLKVFFKHVKYSAQICSKEKNQKVQTVGCCIRFIDVCLLITLWMLNVFPWKTTTTLYTTCSYIIRTTACKQTTTTSRQQDMATYVYMLPYIFADAESMRQFKSSVRMPTYMFFTEIMEKLQTALLQMKSSCKQTVQKGSDESTAIPVNPVKHGPVNELLPVNQLVATDDSTKIEPVKHGPDYEQSGTASRAKIEPVKHGPIKTTPGPATEPAGPATEPAVATVPVT